jgi:hypothetical protein
MNLRSRHALSSAVLTGAALLGCSPPPAKALPPPEYETPVLPAFGSEEDASSPHLAPGSAEDGKEQGMGGAPAFTGAP